ncbi:MAG: acetate/propionate family kinase [Polyangiales bacterium]
MAIGVINAGSSSVKIDVFENAADARIGSARAERVGKEGCQWRVDDGAWTASPNATYAQITQSMLDAIAAQQSFSSFGHRVAHGGERFTAPTLIDDSVVAELRVISDLAPLHNPLQIECIEAARARFPNAHHVAVFDTAFHATLPRRAKAYAIPKSLAEKHHIRRYGFHGTSHQWVSRKAAEFFNEPIEQLRIITCHLGNGASVCAVEYGRSVETSMGMTPVEGLVMGTRSGDIDAGVMVALMRDEHLDADAIDALLNTKSGLAGMTNTTGDMRDLEERAAAGDDDARLAISVFAHRLRKYIGAYAAVMGGVDAIVFTGGIGENSALIRHRAAQRLDYLGARIDEARNRDAHVSLDAPVAEISSEHSRVRLLAIQTDEAKAIAEATHAISNKHDRVDETFAIPVAISARHIHLTRAAVDKLFGAGHQLTPYKPLSQPGQYACEEKLDIIGPKGTIKNVRVLGPERSDNQVEISRTDEFTLGIDAPIRISGDVKNTPGVLLRGPKGELQLDHGVICARRHIHMTPDDAARFGVKDGDTVSVALDTQDRDLIFGDVTIRVSPKFKLEMHLDTDEGNAAELEKGVEGALVSTGKNVKLLKKVLM